MAAFFLLCDFKLVRKKTPLVECIYLLNTYDYHGEIMAVKIYADAGSNLSPEIIKA